MDKIFVFCVENYFLILISFLVIGILLRRFTKIFDFADTVGFTMALIFFSIVWPAFFVGIVVVGFVFLIALLSDKGAG